MAPIDIRTAAPVQGDYLIQHIPHRFQCDPVQRALFEEHWTAYHAALRAGYPDQPDQPWDPLRVQQLMHLVEMANSAPPADYLELGTHRGFSARLIWRHMRADRKLFCFDTFEGFTEADVATEKAIYDNGWTAGGFESTSVEQVGRFIGSGETPENLVLVKGWFPDSFEPYRDHRWCFVHIDMDLYQPIRTALDMTWPAVVPGGIVVVHDYGCLAFPGVRKAVDEFCKENGLRALPMGDRWGSVMLAKGDERNR